MVTMMDVGVGVVVMSGWGLVLVVWVILVVVVCGTGGAARGSGNWIPVNTRVNAVFSLRCLQKRL